MSHRSGRASAILGAIATSSTVLASCASSPASQLSEVAFDPSRNGLLILETSAFNLGISGTDPFVLQQYDSATGKPGPAWTELEIVGNDGRFVFAQAPAGFHVVQSYEAMYASGYGKLCYDVQSYGVTVAPGAVVLIGKLDLAQTQKDVSAAQQAFNRFEPVPPGSPQARDRIIFELTRNFSIIDQVAIKRDMFAKAIETPFSTYENAEHTFRVVRRLYLTSMGAPSFAPASAESLTAAKEFVRGQRPDLADRVEQAVLTPVSLVPPAETCAPGSIASR
jgi:hypothetical protein